MRHKNVPTRFNDLTPEQNESQKQYAKLRSELEKPKPEEEQVNKDREDYGQKMNIITE